MPGFREEYGKLGRRRALLARAFSPLMLGALAIEGSACAMQQPDRQAALCSVEMSAKLSPALQEAAICGPIARAAEAAARDAGLAAGAVTVKVEVLSPHSLTATTVVEGRALPMQRLDISDRPLGASSINMLAQAVAVQIAQLRATRS